MEKYIPGQENENYDQQNTDRSAEAEVRFDAKTVRESNERYKKFSKEKIESLKAEAKAILTQLAANMDKPIESSEIQALVRKYHAYMENYYHLTREIFLGLAELYVIDPEFTAYFERIQTNLADYLSRSMQHYCNTEFKEITAKS